MAFDVFLKIDGIPGESTDDKHKDWIELESYHHGVTQPTSGAVSTAGGRTGGRCDHSDFTIVKALDKSSPKLALFCCNGAHIKEIKIELCRAGEDKQKYMEYILKDSIISAVRPGGSAHGEGLVPLEEVSFCYGAIDWTYTATDHKTGKPSGEVKTGWDCHTNKGK